MDTNPIRTPQDMHAALLDIAQKVAAQVEANPHPQDTLPMPDHPTPTISPRY